MCTTPRRTALAAPLRSLNRWFATLLAATLVTLTPFAAAQEAATGVIRGKAQNASNGAYLKNVIVTVAGTNLEASSDEFGNFELSRVPAGERTLKASYAGEADQTFTVTVTPGIAVLQDVIFGKVAGTQILKDGTIVLDPFRVNAERYKNARAIAIAEERNSTNIKNVVSIDEFGYIPSGNVGEFAKFLPGVLLDYGSPSSNNLGGYSDNTANGISVRGFGPEDTAILINGLPVASTIPAELTRQVALDQLTINNAARVELIKVATPDMPNNSPGGQINLVTRNAFEYEKPNITARVFFNFNDRHFDAKKTPGPGNKSTYKTTPGIDFSVTYPHRRTFGVTISGSAQRNYSETERAQPIWDGFGTSSSTNTPFVINMLNGTVASTVPGQAVSSLENPYLSRYRVTNSALLSDSRSANFGVDWRPTPNQTLRANVQYSTYKTSSAQRYLTVIPAIVNNTDWSANSTQTIGASTSNGQISMTVNNADRLADTLSAQLTYDLSLFGFHLTAAGSSSKSKGRFVDVDNGHFSEVTLNLNPSRVALYGLHDGGIPDRIEAFWRASGSNTTSTPKDYTQFANWSSDSTTGKFADARNERTINLYKIDVSRPLDFIPRFGNQLTVQFGFRRDEELNKKYGKGINYAEYLKTGATYPLATTVDDTYLGFSPGYGLAPQQWASTYKLYEYEQANDIFEVPTDGANAVGNWDSYVGQNKDLKETKDAFYAMLTGKFFDNRLVILGGARQENARRVGRTGFTDTKWNFVKNKDGTVYTDAAHAAGVRIDDTASDLFANTSAGTSLRSALTSAGITFPTTAYGPAGTSLASRMLNRVPLYPVNQKQQGDPSYSVNALYHLTKKIDLKAAWSRSFQLPPIESSSSAGYLTSGSNFSINDYNPTEESSNGGFKGEINMGNPNLKPAISSNWDFEASYYTEGGGKFTASYYTKSVTNQIITLSSLYGSSEFFDVVSALGLDPDDYQNWVLKTSTNASSVQKTSGWEFQVYQDFAKLGKWGQRFAGFASFSIRDWPPPAAVDPITITRPDGSTLVVTRSLSTVTIRAKRSASAGLQFSNDRLSIQLRGTYKGENEIAGNRVTRVTTAGTKIIRVLEPAETRIDLNVNYKLTKRYSLFLSGRDIFNGERTLTWRDDEGLLPDYANLNDRKSFGVTWTIGASGTW